MGDRNSPRGRAGISNEDRGESKDPETPKGKVKRKPPVPGKKSEKLQIVGFNVKKTKNPVHVDENTTNSDVSEGNNLLSDVDWEGNLDNDAQLDEFAPRRRLEESQSPPPLAHKISDLIMTSTSLSTSRASFEAGEKVKVHNYNTSSWEEGVIEEMDEVEQEVLVVSNGRKEWLSINSHRISKLEMSDSSEPSGVSGTESQISLGDIMGTSRPDSDQLKPQSNPTPLKAKKKPAQQEPVKHALSPKDSMYFRSRRNRLKWSKPKKIERGGTSGSSKSLVGVKTAPPSKFTENEKVLAKWSNHRMQKFPAVVRRVYGNGDYDVLFYDGFEKTMSEDNIYKVTEEECAKYQGANPSLADSFVEIDDGSKEARRQRKKKIFDDYLSPKDFERPRKKIPIDSGVRRLIQQRGSVGPRSPQSSGFNLLPMPKRNRFKPEIDSPREGSVPSDQASDVESIASSPLKVPPEPGQSPSAMKSPRPSQDLPGIAVSEEPPQTPPTTTSVPGPESPVVPKPATPSSTIGLPENVQTVDNKPSDPPPVEDSSSSGPNQKDPPVVIAAAPPRPASIGHTPPDYGDRFICDIPEGSVPVIIKTKDGLLHRSVIVGDRNLLPGWVKHAVYIRGKHQIFLISPEGYKLNTRIDLQDYYTRTLKMPAPPVLDFVVDLTVVDGLREKQKELDVPPVKFPTWKVKKGKGGGSGRAKRPGPKPTKLKTPGDKSRPKTGKVRTLLPKYRYVPVPLEPPEREKEVVWNCPKEDCGKTFRKESLLQMHIKHYHPEMKPLVGSLPNVADLATARSENNYIDNLKPQLQPLKRPSKTSPLVGLAERYDSEYSSSPAQGSVSPQIGVSFTDDLLQARPTPLKRFLPPNFEERKSTIKTLLPLRHPTIESQNSVTAESDYYDSEDEFKLTHKPPIKKIRCDPSSFDSYTEEEKGSPIELTEDGVVIERMRSEEIINCTCGFREEDGLMIQCDICMCWQHGICCNITSDMQVPERYVCYICRHPSRVRSSAKHGYAVHYLTMGKLPTFSFRSKDEKVIRERENLIKKCFDLTSNLHQMGNVGQSLAVKLKIAERRDHPKLYLWAKNWRNDADKSEQPADATKSVAPQPEAPIDFEDCRERLVKDVENNLQTLDERLNLISNQISCLEAQASGSGQLEANLSTNTIKQTLMMLTKDLKDLEKLAVITQP